MTYVPGLTVGQLAEFLRTLDPSLPVVASAPYALGRIEVAAPRPGTAGGAGDEGTALVLHVEVPELTG